MNTAPQIPGCKVYDRDGIRYVELHASRAGAVYRELRERVTGGISGKSFTGATTDELQRWLGRGNPDQVKRADAFAKEVEREVPVRTSAGRLTQTVAGGAISVPTYLAGNPRCFSRQVVMPDSSNPLRVFVDIGASGGVSASDVEKRGLALCAFAKVVAGRRPIELVAYNYINVDAANTSGPRGRDVCIMVRFNLKPVNWGHVGAIIGHPAFMRDFTFRLAYAACSRSKVEEVRWGTHRQGGRAGRPLPKVLREKREDLVFTGQHLFDACAHEPLLWVKRELDKVLGAL